jgi:hypothetical protein
MTSARLAFDRPRAHSGNVTRTKHLARRIEHAAQLASADEPPVIARLVVEIRSDGNRTVARGALEHGQLGERTCLEAEAASPLQLAFSLAKALFKVPAFARSIAPALLVGRSEAPRRDDVRARPTRPSRRTRADAESGRRTVERLSRGAVDE